MPNLAGKTGRNPDGAEQPSRAGRLLGGARPYAVRRPVESGDPAQLRRRKEPSFYGLISERMLGIDTQTGFSDAVLNEAISAT
jgi:hypothetical protein